MPAAGRRDTVRVGIVVHADSAEAVGEAVEHHRQVVVMMVQWHDHGSFDAVSIHHLDKLLDGRAELRRVERVHTAPILGRPPLEQVEVGVDDHRLTGDRSPAPYFIPPSA